MAYHVAEVLASVAAVVVVDSMEVVVVDRSVVAVEVTSSEDTSAADNIHVEVGEVHPILEGAHMDMVLDQDIPEWVVHLHPQHTKVQLEVVLQ